MVLSVSLSKCVCVCVCVCVFEPSSCDAVVIWVFHFCLIWSEPWKMDIDNVCLTLRKNDKKFSSILQMQQTYLFNIKLLIIFKKTNRTCSTKVVISFDKCICQKINFWKIYLDFLFYSVPPLKWQQQVQLLLIEVKWKKIIISIVWQNLPCDQNKIFLYYFVFIW